MNRGVWLTSHKTLQQRYRFLFNLISKTAPDGQNTKSKLARSKKQNVVNFVGFEHHGRDGGRELWKHNQNKTLHQLGTFSEHSWLKSIRSKEKNINLEEKQRDKIVNGLTSFWNAS